jgi:hypothetical protein
MRTTAYARETRFEIVSIKQDANGYTIVCVDRTQPGAATTIEVHEDDLTQAEHNAAIKLFETLEKAFERRYLGWETDPSRTREAVAAAAEAERKRKLAELETLRLEAEAVERTARLTALDEEHAKKRAALDAEILALESRRQKLEAPSAPEGKALK